MSGKPQDVVLVVGAVATPIASAYFGIQVAGKAATAREGTAAAGTAANAAASAADASKASAGAAAAAAESANDPQRVGEALAQYVEQQRRVDPSWTL